MSKFRGFQEVQLRTPQKSTFDLSHDKRLTTRMGNLTPVLMMECVPSDRFRGGSEVLLRLAPLLAPIYDQISLWVHYFFVPNRLLWEEWETFITGGRLGPGSSDPAVAPIPPRMDIGDYFGTGDLEWNNNRSLSAMLGMPNLLAVAGAGAWGGKYMDMMPYAAYQKVYMDYYRDRNFVADDVMPEMPLPSGTQDDLTCNRYTRLQVRNYLHDYFTSALPFTQRGEEVLMPVALGGNAPLYYEPVGGETSVQNLQNAGAGPSYAVQYGGIPNPVPGISPSGLYIKGEDFDGTSTSINDFRAAYALQVWLERNAIGGSRYTESTQAHFGVRPQDSRLQRAEYIGGGRINVQISEVVSTAWSNDGAAEVPLANLAGHGISYGNTNRFNYFCVEHGFIIGIASIMAPPSYQQGMPRMFRRRSFLDYPWPTFAKLGEQPVNDFEIYTTPASLTEDADGEFPIFGYQSRYADWKQIMTTNAGDFRDTFLFWTLTRTFTTAPVLGYDFNIFQDDTQDRIFAVEGSDNFWLYVHNTVHVNRALPYFGTPNTMGFGS